MHGTGIVDYGAVGVLPTIGMTPEKTAAEGRRARFSHDAERAAPGSYEVTLDDGTKVELTATERVAIHRYTFPHFAGGYSARFGGMPVFFAARFSRPFAAHGATWARWALANEYGDGPDGLPGNDDGGTMSAWWLFAASGIFPRVGTSEYLVGAPTLARVTLELPGGNFVITTKGPANGHPIGATLNGARLPRPRFDHAQIEGGGTLEVELAEGPRGWN